MSLMLRPLEDVREQMERMFSELTEDFGLPTTLRNEFKRPFRIDGFGTRTWIPAIDVSETEAEYVVKAEIPGINPEDIIVEVMNNVVTLSGESRSEKKEDKRNYHRSEIRYGRFYRQIPLPTEVKSESSRAEFHNGILELFLPKLEENKRQKVKIDIKTQK
jgi:HSP20 family protein